MSLYWDGLVASDGVQALINGTGHPAVIGDSITYYMTPHWTGLGPCNGPYANLGFPGAMLEDMCDYAVPMLAKVKPSAAIILIGINNALDAQNSRPNPFINGLGVIIPALRVWTNKIALATILPMEKGIPGIADAASIQPFVINLNGIIRQAATVEGVCLLETNAAFAGPDGFALPGNTVDSVHPSAAGFAALKPLYDGFLS
jgi:hypothetical protein